MTERRTLLALLSVVGLTHILLPLNTGLYLDDYMLIDQLKSRDWQRLYEVGDAMGNLGHTFLQWPFAAFPEPFAAMKTAVFVSLLLSAVFVYRTALESALVNRLGAFFVAATAVNYPAYMMTFAPNIAGYSFTYLFFSIGAWCALRAQRAGIGYRVAAWLFLLASFVTQSFLVFHFGLLAFLFLASRRPPVEFAKRNADLLALPFVFWILHETLNPVHGWAKELGYNAISFSPSVLLPVYGNLAVVVLGQWAVKWKLGAGSLLLAGTVLWLWTRRRPLAPAELAAAERRWALTLALGVAWLALAAFPYAAVGKEFGRPGIVDWATRNRLLLQLPIAIVLLGAAGAMAARWPRARIAALCAVLVWSFALRTDTYLVWQAQAVKDEAIRQKIAALPEARKYQVIAVHDRYDIVDPSWYGNDLVLWWSYALKMVFGDFTRFGIYEHDEKRALSLQRYVAADIDRLLLRDRVHPPAFDAAAPQVSVIVDPGPRASRRRLALDYYVARLRGEAAVRDLLGGVVSVRVIERR